MPQESTTPLYFTSQNKNTIDSSLVREAYVSNMLQINLTSTDGKLLYALLRKLLDH